MGIKSVLLKVYNFGYLSKARQNHFQKIVRDTEWEAIAPYIKKGKFLDVGCGAGYSMQKAKNMGEIIVYGIDPDPKGHGVGREGSGFDIAVDNIIQATAESIPFDDGHFNTVYSSHVLEHVQDEQKSLSEMKRVLKEDGVLIIGMPTAAMATLNMINQYLFTTHQKFVNFFLSPFIKTGKVKFWQLFVPISHTSFDKTIFYDLKHYRIKNWKKIVEQQFEIIEIITPAFYPYPDMLQYFKLKKNSRNSSSVFFICKKK